MATGTAFTAIEGLIGVGKTSLCRKLAARNHPVVYENINANFLALFYKDPRRYGFAFQLSTMERRLNVLKQQPCWSFLDRSPIGDLAFAATNHALGHLSREEFQVYRELLHGDKNTDHSCIDTLPALDQIREILWLYDDPEACLNRAKGDSTRDDAATRGITLDYMRALDDHHFILMLHIAAFTKTPVKVYWWGEYDEAVGILSRGRPLTKEKAEALLREQEVFGLPFKGKIPQKLKNDFIESLKQS